MELGADDVLRWWGVLGRWNGAPLAALRSVDVQARPNGITEYTLVLANDPASSRVPTILQARPADVRQLSVLDDSERLRPFFTALKRRRPDHSCGPVELAGSAR